MFTNLIKKIVAIGLCIYFVGIFSFPGFAYARNLAPRGFNLSSPEVKCLSESVEILLSWSKSSNALYYIVERRENLTWQKISSNISKTTFEDNLPNNGSVLSYRVRAVNRSKQAISNTVIVDTSLCVPAPVPPPPPLPSSVVWGAYTGNTYASLVDFEDRVSSHPNINAVFVGWGDSFPTQLASDLADNNQTILIYWESIGYSYDDLLGGSSDAYIASFGAQAKAFGKNVILVPFAEMNGDWTPWGGTVGSNTPEKFAPMWQHVHDVFGYSPNVKWGWAVNSNSVPDTQENQIEVYYPGDNYVDYVGIDGFNFGTPWVTFDQIFNLAISKLKVYNKPIWIFSMACAEDLQKAEWIDDVLSYIYSSGDISGWIWFNANKEKDWTVWSDPLALQSFQQGIK